MEELTLKQQIDKLVISKSLAVDNLDAVSRSLNELIKQERQENLPKISSDNLDRLLSIVKQSITDTRIDVGNNADVYYSINDNEIDAEISLTTCFTDEVLSDIKGEILQSDILAIIVDGN